MGRLVDDERLRRAVQLAHERGLNKSSIARAAGISRDIVREILTGRPHHRRKPATEVAEHNYSTYANHRCRCHECRAAASAYMKAREADRGAHPPMKPIPRDPVALDRIGDEWADPTGDQAITNVEGA